MPKTIAYEHLSTHDKVGVWSSTRPPLGMMTRERQLFALQKFLELFDETKGAAVQSK